ncbi:hypothetical protein FHT79_004196 [Rhizobium sp. BK212]|nr:hypothetical protein [Rhizobium sp. BK212]
MELVKSVLSGKEALSLAEKQAIIAANRDRPGVAGVGLLKP